MDYKNEVAQYRKKDAVLSLCVYAFVVIYTVAMWSFLGRFEGTQLQSQLVSMGAGLLWIVVVCAIVLVKKQKLASIGMHGMNLRKALTLGCVFALIPLAINVIVPMVLYDVTIRSAGNILFLLLFFLINAAWEDVFFVGFMQTRLYGLFKTDIVAISVGAALFAFVHIPVGLAENGMGLIGSDFVIYLVGLFFMHQMFVLLFRRYFSLATVVVVHTIFNWSYTAIWWWAPETAQYATFWSSIAGLVLIIAVNVWDWRSGLKNKKIASI